MSGGQGWRRWGIGGWATAVALLAPGCTGLQERTKLIQENESFRKENARLERTLGRMDAENARLQAQVRQLLGFGPDRPAAAFAPVRLEIAGRSGGSDFDGKPGDDGVTVYLRPVDADGDAQKVPGVIRVQLLDNSVLGSPRVLGVYEFNDLEEIRKMWHGKFLTHHYTVRCPFPPSTALPANRKVDVRAEFIDYLRGATLAASKEVSIAPAVE